VASHLAKVFVKALTMYVKAQQLGAELEAVHAMDGFSLGMNSMQGQVQVLCTWVYKE